MLYLLAKHFPDRAKTLSPRALENISRPLEQNWFNSLSAGMTLLALDAYASENSGNVDKLGIEELHGGSAKSIAGLQNKLLQMGTWSGSPTGLRFSNGTPLTAWTVVSQSGYDRDVPANAIRNGLEIIREYTAADGKPLGAITLGDEIEVHVKIRATAGKGMGNIAIVDLLPGGFDPIFSAPEPKPARENEECDDCEAARPALRLSASTWNPVYTFDVREDRCGDLRQRLARRAGVHLPHQGEQQRQVHRSAGIRRVHVRPPRAGPRARRPGIDGETRTLMARS